MTTLEARSVEGPFASAPHCIEDFAVECINLNREDAQEYRNRLAGSMTSWTNTRRTIPTAAVYKRECTVGGETLQVFCK
jgi:hypothetical protein